MVKIFCMNLQREIKKHVKGGVKVTHVDGVLIVSIYATENSVFRYTRKNIEDELVQGLTSSWLSNVIVKKYAKYVFDSYFMK